MMHKKCDQCKVRRGRRKAYEIEKTPALGPTTSQSGSGIKTVRKIMLCDICYSEIEDLRQRKS
jgi:hypothetical protein